MASEFDLKPGRKYWLAIDGRWTPVRDSLRDEYGKAAFNTSETREDTEDGEVIATWVVITVKKPMTILRGGKIEDADEWQPGDTEQSTGVFDTPDPSFIDKATGAIDEAKEGARSVADFSKGLGFAILLGGAGLWLASKALNK